MPFSSSALTSVASEYCAGGWVNFCSFSSATSFSRSPSASAGSWALSSSPLGLELVDHLLVDREEAGALEHLARGAQPAAAALDVDLGDVEEGGKHLARHEAVPDQPVELELVRLEPGRGGLGREVEVGRADRLVGVLRSLLRGVDVGLVGQLVGAVAGGDQLAHAGDRLVGDAGRVGAHVGDEAELAAIADHPSLVEPLRQRHRALDREAVAARRLLLQPAGDEGGRGALLRLLALDRGDPELAARELGLDRGGGLGAADLGLPAVELVEPRDELGRRSSGGGGEPRADHPVLDRHEGVDLGLPVADHLERHRLHAPGRQAALNLLPQKRRELEAHQPVEHPARLLRIDEVGVDLARGGERRQHRLLGDLVEGDAVDVLVVAAEHLRDVPGDRFPLAIGVGSEVDAIGLLRRFLQLLDDVLLLGDDDVVGLVVLAQAQVLLGEVADVADRSLHRPVAAQELLERARLGGAFDDDEVLGHGVERTWRGPGSISGGDGGWPPDGARDPTIAVKPARPRRPAQEPAS